MKQQKLFRATAFLCALLFLPTMNYAQGTRADYERANKLRDKFQGLAVNNPERAVWIGKTSRFWYRRSVKGGNEFVLVDVATLTKQPAFDHTKLAASLSTATDEKYTAITLPFRSITFSNDERAIDFIVAPAQPGQAQIAGTPWQCDLATYACKKTTLPPRGQQRGGPPEENPEESPAEYGNDVYDGMAVSPAFQQRGQGQGGATSEPVPDYAASLDGKWEAVIQNFNVFIRPKGKTESSPLSYDGSEGNYYTLASIAWSSDSKYLAAYRVRPGFRREVHYVESSPTDQLQPKHSVREYAKPGDVLDIAQPVLFDLTAHKQTNIDNSFFPNPYSLSRLVWHKDSSSLTFEYNQRGHQVYRVIEVAAATAKPRVVISEEPSTFVDYRPLAGNPADNGKTYRYELSEGKEFIWASERDGWAHLYLYDGVNGKLRNQITKGNWVVRAVEKVDEENRQIWFQASGMYPGKDPYFIHYYRINFDGSGLVAYTETDANHAVTFSPDMKYYVDTWSRVDLPAVSQLRRTEDRKVLLDLDQGDIKDLIGAGWKAPEVFTALGRDGKTDIWGVIVRPTNFDPSKKYPVIENIYAGPQGSFVPKTFNPFMQMQALAELGFIVVQVDGMGTNNRSKAFHDVAWKNLGDAGFPDRILWHKAVAAKYSYYDISRVGIYGTSAGGQNALGALLFHPEFYKVAVSNSGCHDNRMDKIWWNELWMSWPLGSHYAASSNVDNAYRLKGDLLLVLGEMDTNVDPASTLQVVKQLIRANKKFDLLFVPGGGHGAGGAFGQRLLYDYFVHHLLKVEPPDWNKDEARPERTTGAIN